MHRLSRMPLVALVGCLAACTAQIGPGSFECLPEEPGSCPSGWLCLRDGLEHRCYPERSGTCGDGILNPGEECDGSALGALDCTALGEPQGFPICLFDCTVHCAFCGNGSLEPRGVHSDDYEECDDGNGEAGDGCSPTCTIERCGNGILDPGERCDDGNLDPADGCSPLCQLEACGNGVLEYATGEQCDDGNRRSHDGCSSGCTAELPVWRRWQHALLGGRSDYGMTYDSGRDRTVLHGGWDGTRPVSDTWEYQDSEWTQIAVAEPPDPRRDFAMAYDAGLGKTLVYGGYRDAGVLPAGVYADTWMFDGVGWERLDPLLAPGAIGAYDMVYDPLRRLVVIAGTGITSEVWEFNFQSSYPDESCGNGQDDDGDDLIDCADPDCAYHPDCP